MSHHNGAASGAAERPRGEPPAGAGEVSFTLRLPGGQDKCPFWAARRVGSTELLGRREELASWGSPNRAAGCPVLENLGRRVCELGLSERLEVLKIPWFPGRAPHATYEALELVPPWWDKDPVEKEGFVDEVVLP